MQKNELNDLGSIILDACITVHRELGPGLLESAYTRALIREFEIRNIAIKKQVPVELVYKEVPLGKIYVIDILVEDEIILEIKSVETILPIFIFQVITYLKITDNKLGYLINFNVPLLKDGFKRIVHNF
jgi:GxxExxY protein